jgi:uncharacterized protein (TIGR03083 family)
MTDVAALYAEGRGRITALVEGLSDEDAKAPVATCPAWSVHDVLAHITGVCADVLSGNIGGVASDSWTDAQVAARRAHSVKQIVDEWNEIAPQVESFANHFPGRVGDQWVTDQTTHEHDIRLALGRPGARDSEAVNLGADFLIGGFGVALRAHGLGPLEVRAGSRSWLVGGGEPAGDAAAIAEALENALSAAVLGDGPAAPEGSPVGVVEAPCFELMRACTGRRSAAQVAAYSWTVEPAPYVAAFQFGPFTTSPVDIEE